MAAITRYTFHVDQDEGEWFQELADQLRAICGGSGPSLALHVLKHALEELKPSDQWVVDRAYERLNETRRKKLVILDARRAERLHRREHAQRGDNTKPKLSARRLRKDVFSSDADFNKQMPPPQDQDQLEHPTHPTNDIAATTSGTLSQKELDEFAARNERILRGEEKP